MPKEIKKSSRNKKNEKENDFIFDNISNLDNNFIKKNNKENEKIKIVNMIDENRKNINKVEFIKIIKLILSLIIICIIIIYIILINFQINLISKLELILLTYYYSLYTKHVFSGVYSILLNIYYQFQILGNQDFQTNYFILYLLTTNLKETFHNYTMYFYESNLAIGHDFNIMYKKQKFTKLSGFWKEIEYESKYSSEMDLLLYNILSYNPYELLTNGNLIDFKNFLFFHDRTQNREKINSGYVKLLYYICVNWEFAYKKIYNEIDNSIYDSFKLYLNKKMIINLSIEIFGLILYVIFFITVILYLYFSNIIIIKNIIFLFLDYSIENYQKNNNNINKINLKLIELQNIINDFDLNLFEKYSKNIENINNISSHNDSLNITISNHNEQILDSNKNPRKSGYIEQFSLKKKLNKNNSNELNNLTKNNFLMESKNKLMNNSSSQNHLIESNSKFFKDNSFNTNNEILSRKKEEKMINFHKNFNKKNTENADNNYQDIILNKSNKVTILMIKIYSLIILILFLIVIIFFTLKLKDIFSFIIKIDRYFYDLTVLTDRYMQVYYYSNILRTLLIFPGGERKKEYENIMENMNENYEKEDFKFNELFSNYIDNYPEIKIVINTIKEHKNNLTDNSSDIIKDNLKEIICKDEEACILYLDSPYNIFDSGVELTFRANMNQIYNYYMNYKKLINNENINEIKLNIILAQNFRFLYIMESLNYFYVYVEKRILASFEIDQKNFNKSYLNSITLLNIISILFSILTFLFVIIIIFISISSYASPIKDATFRINCSFYYIKKYNLKNYRKLDTNYM